MNTNSELNPECIEAGVPPEIWRYVDAFRRALPDSVSVAATADVFELIEALRRQGEDAIGALCILRDVCRRFYVTKFYALLRSNPDASQTAANATFWAQRVVDARF